MNDAAPRGVASEESGDFSGKVDEAKLIEEEGPIVSGDGEVEAASVGGAIDLVDAVALGDGAKDGRVGRLTWGEQDVEAEIVDGVVKDLQLFGGKGFFGEDEGCNLVGPSDKHVGARVLNA